MDTAASSTSGIADPLLTTPPRRPASVRRTSHIDMLQRRGGGLQLTGAARDLRTSVTGGSVVGAATVDAVLDRERRLERLDTAPVDPRTDGLRGFVVGRGFRAAVDDALPEPSDAASPLYLLLDDLPVAALISGYGVLYSGQVPRHKAAASMLRADICSGWRADGTMMEALRTDGRIPVPLGPPTTDLLPPDDPLAWHEIGPLPVGGMRRRRLVEVIDSNPLAVFAMFRDTFVRPDGVEAVVHEYTFTAELTPESLVLSRCEAVPRVLPWNECPGAAASAHGLNGRRVDEIRELVRNEFRGTATCTHLNDLFRSLADLGPLAASILPTP